MKKLFLLLPLVVLSACSTVAPQPINTNSLYADASTPKQYDEWNSGIITYFTGKDAHLYYVFTANKSASYIKFYGSAKGLDPIVDQYGNHLNAIDVGTLDKWKKDSEGLIPLTNTNLVVPKTASTKTVATKK